MTQQQYFINRKVNIVELAQTVLRRLHKRCRENIRANWDRYIFEHGFCEVVHGQSAITAADFLNDKVLPFFDSEQMRLLRVLTDRDAFMTSYKERRTNQGKRCLGRTPKQTWDDGCELYRNYVIEKMEVTPELEMI